VNGPENSSGKMGKDFWLTLVFVSAYFLAALAALRQWNSPHPWSRLDVFSGGFLLVCLIWAATTMRFHRAIFRSREVMREASGLTYDPWMFRWIVIFAVAEQAVYLDYGHWHLMPALEIPALQWLGLGLCYFGVLWIVWVDRYLSRQFSGDLTARWVMNQGPYRFVRHPRYAALIVSSVAFALALASILAWIHAVGWLWVNLRRIQLEEAHLKKIFGAEYDAYAARTARLFPGIW
jgi:protein-S-isoprenylcysteine O-methyltransferase Ste14